MTPNVQDLPPVPSLSGDRLPGRVLYLTHRVPYPPDKGDRIRNYHLLRQMAQHGRIWLACIADEPISDDVLNELNRLCERVAIVPVTRGRWIRAGTSLLTGRSISEGAFAEPELRKVVRDWASETRFDAAVVSASSMAPYLRDRSLKGVPAIVDLVDVDSQKWSDFADAAHGPKRWLYRHEASRVRKLERTLPSWTHAISVVSRAEADVLDAFAGPQAATVAANGVDLEYFQPLDLPSQQACVFVGAMDYLPNVDAAVWFAREVWPALRMKYPAAEFHIVGRKPAAAVRDLATIPGIKVFGQVPDVRPFVAAAAVVVAPLRLARGIQNKVLEALAMGKALVAAPAALAALSAIPGTDLLSATTPEEWLKTVGDLLENPIRCRDLGAAGRRFVNEHHHWDSCLEPLLTKIFATARRV